MDRWIFCRRLQSGPPGSNCNRAYIFLVLVGLPLPSRLPPPVLWAPRHPLSSFHPALGDLTASSLGRLSPLSGSTKSQATERGRRGRRRGRGGLCHPSAPLPAGLLGPVAEVPRTASREGRGMWEAEEGASARIRANRTLLKAVGLRFPPAPRELQSSWRCPGA